MSCPANAAGSRSDNEGGCGHNTYIKNKRERLLFADELRRKIEKKGYSWSSKERKWIKNQQVSKNHVKNTTIKSDIGKSKTTDPVKNVTSEEIVEKLNAGKSLSEIEKETSLSGQNLRLLLKREGYKYDGFFKTWINVERTVLLNNIVIDIANKKKTLQEIADYYQISKEALYNLLIKMGYHIDENNKRVTNEETKGLENRIKAKVETKEIEQKKELKVVKDIDAEVSKAPFSESEIQILKNLIKEKKESQDSDKKGKKPVKLYLTEDLLEVLDEQAEINSLSKSALIERALISYLENVKS